LVTANVKQYAWDNTTGLSNERNGFLTVSGFGSVVGNYKTQYYLSVSSAHNSPDPSSGWVDAGASVTASVTSPDAGPSGTRYVCTGWTGTGSVPASGGDSTVTFTVTQASGITWNWITQYLLGVDTNPPGLVVIPGSGWYNSSANVVLTAPSVVNYDFSYWDVDGSSQGNGVNPIMVQMNAPHGATAHYTPTVQAYTLTVSSTAGGTTNPTPGSYIYVVNSVVPVYANALPNYLFDHWVFDGGNVGSINPYSVTMNMNHTLQAVFAPIPPVVLSITPPDSTIYLGNHVTFTSTVSGGTSPYSYQWYLDSSPVSGAVLSSWTFSPSAPGVYYVYLKVTDANDNTVQSSTAKVTVTSPPPVGGYSVSLERHTSIANVIAYLGTVAMLGLGFVLVKRRRK
jgi:hypothetical protein